MKIGGDEILSIFALPLYMTTYHTTSHNISYHCLQVESGNKMRADRILVRLYVRSEADGFYRCDNDYVLHCTVLYYSIV